MSDEPKPETTSDLVVLPRARSRVPLFEDLEPPDLANPLAINSYGHAVLGVALQQVIRDPGLDEETRRKQIADITGRMAALTPQSVIAAAARANARDAADASHADGARVEPVILGANRVTGGTENSGITPIRGRPRKSVR